MAKTSPTPPATGDLSPVLARPSIPKYAQGVWDRRDFIATVPMNHMRSANMDTLLGNLWFFVNPVLQTVVYFLIFGVLLEVDRGVDDYLSYLIIGVLSFSFVTSSLLAAARCLQANLTLIRSMYFPRAAIPISTTLSGVYTFAPSILVMALVVVGSGHWPTWRWLLLPLVLVMMVAMTQGAVFVVARVGKAVPDLHSLLPHLIRVLFYCSGVLFAPASFSDNAVVLWLFKLNPFFEMLEMLRWVFMGRSIDGELWGFGAGWAIVSVVGGAWYFWRGEITYGSS